MRKIFLLLLICILLFSIKGISQTISDTGTLRTTINTQIIPNGQREISANQLNRILNGLMNTLTPYGVDSLSYDSVTNRIFGYRYSGFPTLILQLKRVYNTGTVTSIGLSVPTGFTVSPSSITSSGIFSITDTLSNGVVHSATGAFVSGKIVNADVNDVAWTKITGVPSFLILSSLSATSPVLYNNSTGVISELVGSSSQNGYITSSDWTTFNAKQNPITWQNVSAGSSKIALGGTPGGSVNSPFSIDVNEANLTLGNIGGTLPINKGGTNATTAITALNNLFPSQSGKSGYSAVSDGTNINWVLISAGAGFTRVFGTNGLTKVNDSTLKQGGQFTQNTIFSGQNLYSILYDSLTTFSINGKLQTNQKAYYLTHPTFLTADSLAFIDYETLNNAIATLPLAYSQLTDVNLTSLSNGQIPTYNFSTSKWVNSTLTTSIVPEGSNPYFTNARARSAISSNAPISYNNSTGVISADTTTAITGLATQYDNSLKVNKTDTNTMLVGYLRKIDTSTNVLTAISGAGTRFEWLSSKKAIRAGQVTSTEWNASNIGTGSAAFGSQNTASGNFSFAMGAGEMATGFASVALGSSSIASGNTAITFGNTNLSSGDFSLTAGQSNTASGLYSAAFGQNNTARALGSAVFGNGSLAKVKNSVVIGQFNDTFSVSKVFQVGWGTGISGLTIFSIDTLGNAFLLNHFVGITESTGDSSNFLASTAWVKRQGYGSGSSIANVWATAINSANYTISSANAVVLSDLTGQTNRNLVLPSSPIGNQLQLLIYNINSSSFNWTFTGATVKDAANNTITTINNTQNYFLNFDTVNSVYRVN